MVLLISELVKIGATKPIFLDSGTFPQGGGVLCVHGLCYHCIYSSSTKVKGKTLFSLSLTAICAELCCQTASAHIPLLCAKLGPQRRHLRSKTMAKVYPKSWFLMHAFDWPEQTLKIQIQYSTYFACNNDLCRGVLTNLLGDIFLSFFATFEP